MRTHDDDAPMEELVSAYSTTLAVELSGTLHTGPPLSPAHVSCDPVAKPPHTVPLGGAAPVTW